MAMNTHGWSFIPFIMIIIGYFYTALFSALKQTHCTLVTKGCTQFCAKFSTKEHPWDILFLDKNLQIKYLSL